MKVKDLIELLKVMDKDREVIVAADAEGNSYSPLASSFGLMAYKDGQVGIEKLTPELKKERYTHEDVLKGKSAIILYPV